MRIIYCILALFFLLPHHALKAQTKFEWTTKQEGNYRYSTVLGDPMQARYYKLKNGLTVILTVNPLEPRIQTIIATKAGSKNDPKEHTGLAHYLEHMLFKGTDQYGTSDFKKEKVLLDKIDSLYEEYNHTKDETKRKEIYRQIDATSNNAAKYAIANEYDKMLTNIGAKGTNAFTSFETTAYVNDIPSNQIDQWLEIEAERFRNPVLRLFHTELEAVYEEKNISMDRDGSKVFEALFAGLFQNHNYGLQTTIGTVDHLKNPSLKAIRDFYNTYYVPNNMCLIMSGNFIPQEVIQKIDKKFSTMVSKEVPAYTFTPEPEITSPKKIDIYGPEAEYLNIAFRFPGANTKDAMMLNMMTNLLSNGTAGLMDLNLVKNQKVLEASAGSWNLKDYSVLFIDGKAKEGQSLEEVEKLILSEIENLKKGNFDDRMLAAVVNNYRKTKMTETEDNANRAYTILDAFMAGIDWKDQSAQLDVYNKITKKEIMDFTSKYMKENYVVVYKHHKEGVESPKIEKPHITAVETNRDKESPFVTNVAKMPFTAMIPVFVDYKNDLQKGKIANLEALISNNKDNQLFSHYYYYEMGSYNNKLLPLAVEYLNYLGTNKYTVDQLSKEFYTMASSFGVSANKEETYVYVSGLNDNYEKTIQLFDQLLNDCVPNEQALKDLISATKKNRADAKLNKRQINQGLINFAKYGEKNPFNYVLSDEELDQVTAQQLVDIIHDLKNYSHKVLYYGPLDLAQLRNYVSVHHKTPATFKDIPAPVKFEPIRKTEPEVYFCDYDMVQTEIGWALWSDPYDLEKVPTVTLFNEYFGGGMSSLVFQTIRESKALAYSTYAMYSQPFKKEYPFQMFAYVGCQADKMPEAITSMKALLDYLPKSEKMFEQAKMSLKNSYSTSKITKEDILFNYLSAQRLGQTTDIRKKTFENLDKLDFNTINAFHKDKISGKPYTLTVLGSKDKVSKDVLEAYGKVNTIGLKEIFGY